MNIIRLASKENVPASHENPQDPGVMKRVLLQAGELKAGKIQMINWATLLPHKSFATHYHEDMQEIFIMIEGSATAHIDDQEVILDKGDTLVVDPGERHDMYNPSDVPVVYIVVGIAGDKKGKSVNV
jgi:mannose-6-phosphate isomerase-like protein (cupin superfamily)